MWRGPLAYGQATADRTLLMQRGSYGVACEVASDPVSMADSPRTCCSLLLDDESGEAWPTATYLDTGIGGALLVERRWRRTRRRSVAKDGLWARAKVHAHALRLARRPGARRGARAGRREGADRPGARRPARRQRRDLLGGCESGSSHLGRGAWCSRAPLARPTSRNAKSPPLGDALLRGVDPAGCIAARWSANSPVRRPRGRPRGRRGEPVRTGGRRSATGPDMDQEGPPAGRGRVRGP